MDAFEDPLLGRFQSQASLRLCFKYHGDSIVAILQLPSTLFQLFHSFSLQFSIISIFSVFLHSSVFHPCCLSWWRVYSRRSHWVWAVAHLPQVLSSPARRGLFSTTIADQGVLRYHVDSWFIWHGSPSAYLQRYIRFLHASRLSWAHRFLLSQYRFWTVVVLNFNHLRLCLVDWLLPSFSAFILALLFYSGFHFFTLSFN